MSKLSPDQLKRRRSSSVSARDPLPVFIPPQLTQLVEEPPAGPEWAHEIKYVGYRIHARLGRGRVKLLTRTGSDWTDKYAAVAEKLAAIGKSAAYLDGELCAMQADGTTSFSPAATRASRRAGELTVSSAAGQASPEGARAPTSRERAAFVIPI